MTTPDERVERLERECRRLSRQVRLLALGGGLALVGAAVVLGGGGGGRAVAGGKVVEAERFVLRDERGAHRAELLVGSSGRTEFFLRDGAGRAHLAFVVADDGRAFVVVTDQDDKARAVLDSSPRLALSDQYGRERLQLAVAPQGSPGLTLWDKENRPRLEFNVLGEQGRPGLKLCDEGGRPVFEAPR
jgi:hypothetical protein